MKHIFTNGEKCKGWPNDSQVHSKELRMFRALVGKENKHQIGPLGHH
jgi:hypothetical protein